MLPLHQGLYSALHEAEGYPFSCQALRLLPRNLRQQLYNLNALLHCWFILPEPIIHWCEHAGLRQLRRAVLDVEPFVLLVLI